MAMEKRNVVTNQTPCVRDGTRGSDCQCPHCTAKRVKQAASREPQGIRDTDAFSEDIK